MIRAPLVHYYFERIHPFNDGNGRVGRLIEKTILIASGDEYAGRGLDRYYLENIDDYFTVFNMVRKLEKTHPDECNHAFVEFVLTGLAQTIERLHHRANGLMGCFLVLAWLGDLLKNKAINNREYVLLDYLGTHTNPIRIADLKKIPWHKELYRQYSAATESRDWNHLLQSKLITKSGQDFVVLNIPL
jgi:hypothetical protein